MSPASMTLRDLVERLDADPVLTPALTKTCRDAIVVAGNGWATAEAAYHNLKLSTIDKCFNRHWFGARTDDPGLGLFVESLKAGGFTMAPYSRVLEVGCVEADWMGIAGHADPTLHLVGVDWRARATPSGVYLKTDIRTAPFAEETFDWMVSLSAIEHIGLGHYDNDPADPDGDAVAMQNVVRWLKPGGQVYLDVPYTPEGFTVCDTSHRTYDDAALESRLLRGLTVRWIGYSTHRPIQLVDKPRQNANPFHYVAIHAQKAA